MLWAVVNRWRFRPGGDCRRRIQVYVREYHVIRYSYIVLLIMDHVRNQTRSFLSKSLSYYMVVSDYLANTLWSLIWLIWDLTGIKQSTTPRYIINDNLSWERLQIYKRINASMSERHTTNKDDIYSKHWGMRAVDYSYLIFIELQLLNHIKALVSSSMHEHQETLWSFKKCSHGSQMHLRALQCKWKLN